MSQQGMGKGGWTESGAQRPMGYLDCESDGRVGGTPNSKFEGCESESFNHEVLCSNCHRTLIHPLPLTYHVSMASSAS